MYMTEIAPSSCTFPASPVHVVNTTCRLWLLNSETNIQVLSRDLNLSTVLFWRVGACSVGSVERHIGVVQ